MGDVTLQTRRLSLRPWCESDAEALYCCACDPQVGPAAGWSPHTSVDNSLEIIRKVLSAPNTFALVMKDIGKPVGSVGVFPTDLPAALGEPEIGYWIARSLWGQGLVPEAVEELLHWQFEEKNAVRVWCAHFPGNEKSRRVIEKCGLTYVCTGEEQLWPDGSRRASLYYAITRQEWEVCHG